MTNSSRPVLSPNASVARTTAAPGVGAVRALPFRGDNAELVASLLRGHPGAAAALHDRFARRVRGLLFRLLGVDSELDDALQDVFVRALESLPRLRDPAAFESWLMGVTVRVARTRLQRRSRRWWLRVMSNEELPEPAAPPPDYGAREAWAAAYRTLNTLPVDDRLAFVLRFAEGMTIAEAAQTMGMSVSTLKRRLRRGEQAFLSRARSEPALCGWLAGGSP